MTSASRHPHTSGMTTAHRPTFNPAKGGTSSLSVSQGGYFTGGAVSQGVSVRQLPSHKLLKLRADGQATSSDVAKRDLRRELEEKERAHFEQIRRDRERKYGVGAVGSGGGMPAILNGAGSGNSRALEDKASVAASSVSGAASRNAASEKSVDDILAAFDDRDDDVLERAAEGSVGSRDEDGGNGDGAAGRAAAAAADYDDDEDDEDEDDTEELMRELERIKKQREDERLRREREAAELVAKRDTADALVANPLLGHLAGAAGAAGLGGIAAGGGAGLGSAAVKRRFGDDTVFSHTHSTEPEVKKRFINDVIRSDFHRNFLRKFVQ